MIDAENQSAENQPMPFGPGYTGSLDLDACFSEAGATMEDYDFQRNIESYYGVLRILSTSWPYMLGLMLGAAIGVMGWSRSRKASMAVLAGVAIGAFGWFCSPFLELLVLGLSREYDAPRLIVAFLEFISFVAKGAAVVFLCLAAFLDRHPPGPLEKR